MAKWKYFYHLPASIVECVSKYMFFVSEKYKHVHKQNAKETKEEKKKTKETKEEKGESKQWCWEQYLWKILPNTSVEFAVKAVLVGLCVFSKEKRF